MHLKGSNTDFVDPRDDVQVFCGPAGICGGGMAQCAPDPGSHTDIGESSACVSGKPYQLTYRLHHE